MSNRALLLTYSPEFGSERQVLGVIDDLPQVVNWRREFPNSVFLVSPLSAENLATLLRQRVSKKGSFFITELAWAYSGWCSNETWEFLRVKGPPDDEEGATPRLPGGIR